MSDDEDAAQPQEQPEREVNPKVLEKELRDKYRLGESELEDIKDAHALFADGDSLGSQIDFGNAIRSLNQYPTEAEIINMWKNAFLNEDEGMDVYEFIRLVGERGLITYPDSVGQLEDAFIVFDKDKTGLIPVDDFRRMMMQMGEPVTKADVDEMLKVVEVTTDNKMIYADFINKITAK